MLILANYGFEFPTTRASLKRAIGSARGTMLIISLGGTRADAEAEMKGALQIGFKEENVYIFDADKADELMSKDYTYIEITAGNTFQLLSQIRCYNLDEFINAQIDKRCTLIGLSAGACICCPNTEYVLLFDDNNHISDGDYTGLGLMNQYVLCHYDIRGTTEKYEIRRFIGYESDLITITGDDVVVIDNKGGIENVK
ncbi:MAG: Type 1 glutamine amidotransferase-like domain-containing protein [Ruminococcus sp.]|nr:Type 1 glutamine amidotransferase-like domain-containing protein [Ruminococcus sp.]